MPGFILHLLHGKMILEQDNLNFSETEKKQFQMGILMPDVSQYDRLQKDNAHFMSPNRKGCILEYPDLNLFPYLKDLSQPFVIGYAAHLYLDKYFYEDYFTQYVHFLDSDGKITEKKTEVKNVYLVNAKSNITVRQLFSEAYVYGDYTNLNHYFIQKYQLETAEEVPCKHPITEVKDQDFSVIQNNLKRYLNDYSGNNKTKVFTSESLETTIRVYASGFLQWLIRKKD